MSAIRPPSRPAASNGSGAAPSGDCASRVSLTSCSAFRASRPTVGKRGSISISALAITAAGAIRAYHLRSAGITCHGAHSVLVLDSILENARW